MVSSPLAEWSDERLAQSAGRWPLAHGLGGHYWTLRSHFAAQYARTPLSAARPWKSVVVDPTLGEVPLAGLWSELPGSRRALILVHGLGGQCESPYLDAVARAAGAAGMSTLRLSLRGADRAGGDLYHAGSWQDVAAAARSPELAGHDELALVGYSLGGHVVLRYALDAGDPRLKAVAAVCPPLDLELGALAFDRAAWIYRYHVLRALKEMFHAVLRRQGNVAPWNRIAARDVARIGSIVEWDQRVIAPRYAFRDAFDYYRRTSVGPRLAALPCRTLIVSAEHDPMVRFSTLEAALAACTRSDGSARSDGSTPATPPLIVRRLRRAGHLGFPNELDLGFGNAPGIAPQLVHFVQGD